MKGNLKLILKVHFVNNGYMNLDIQDKNAWKHAGPAP